MKQIYSKIDKSKLLHIVYTKNDLVELQNRQDVIPESEFLQMSGLKLGLGKTFKPHKHIYKEGPKECIAQESWVVVQGKVRVFYYDLDDEIINEEILGQGDCSITLYGGHNYLILEDNTLVYEFKTGPYQGQELDKVFI